MRPKTGFLILILGLGSLAHAASEGWDILFNIPGAYRIGTLYGEKTGHYYIGTGIDAGRSESLLQLHAGIHTYLGPFMFADMNQPNEIDIGPQLAIPFTPSRSHVLTLGAGPALFFSSNGNPNFRQMGGYVQSSLMNAGGRHFRWGPFLQYSAGKTDFQETNYYFPIVWTSGVYFGINFQYALRI